MKYIITLLSVFTFFNSFSQTQEQIYQFKYEMSKEFKKQPNYKIIYKTTFKNGTGYMKVYDDSLSLVEEGKYENSKKVGNWKSY